VDHINFFTNVQTELGALLSTENRLPFAFGPVNKDGVVQGDTFESLKCLWAYYRTSCLIDGFRTVQDFKIRKLYRTINEFPKQESIFAVMVMGYYCKMLAYPTLAEALVKNTLPFDYYSVHNGVKKRTAVSKLMVNASMKFVVHSSSRHCRVWNLSSLVQIKRKHLMFCRCIAMITS